MVTSESITNYNNCSSCVMGGSGFEIHRICIFDASIPINFPKENRETCSTELCNGKTVDNTAQPPPGPIAKPISCYTCLNCTKNNEKVISGCGGCVTTHGSGVTSKFCGPTCDKLEHEYTVGCCSTDKCNGMTKLSVHRHVIVVLFVCMGISKYIL
ncbi:unnamed protein product [Schistosoma mattheei]|uniref:Uncharacterized protein n=1 Tax=Schistosoma mattheei TaxID=31246 RepID=A0A183NZ51_9TREM|nr:unnamed protein product [Schistosoma mattheei]